MVFFFFQAEDGIRDVAVTGVQTCALPISQRKPLSPCLEALPRHAAASLSEDPGEELASPDVRAIPTARPCPSPGSRSPPQNGRIDGDALAAGSLFEETLPHCRPFGRCRALALWSNFSSNGRAHL